jgi:hypothetical protein
MARFQASVSPDWQLSLHSHANASFLSIQNPAGPQRSSSNTRGAEMSTE